MPTSPQLQKRAYPKPMNPNRASTAKPINRGLVRYFSFAEGSGAGTQDCARFGSDMAIDLSLERQWAEDPHGPHTENQEYAGASFELAALANENVRPADPQTVLIAGRFVRGWYLNETVGGAMATSGFGGGYFSVFVNSAPPTTASIRFRSQVSFASPRDVSITRAGSYPEVASQQYEVIDPSELAVLIGTYDPAGEMRLGFSPWGATAADVADHVSPPGSPYDWLAMRAAWFGFALSPMVDFACHACALWDRVLSWAEIYRLLSDPFDPIRPPANPIITPAAVIRLPCARFPLRDAYALPYDAEAPSEESPVAAIAAANRIDDRRVEIEWTNLTGRELEALRVWWGDGAAVARPIWFQLPGDDTLEKWVAQDDTYIEGHDGAGRRRARAVFVQITPPGGSLTP